DVFRDRMLFRRAALLDLLVQRAQLRREHLRDRALRVERGAVAAGDERAEVAALDEPAVDVGARHHARGAHAVLDERHLAEDVAVAQAGDGEHAAAGKRDLRLDLARAQQERAARGLALAHEARPGEKRHRTRYGEQLFVKQAHFGRVYRGT